MKNKNTFKSLLSLLLLTVVNINVFAQDDMLDLLDDVEDKKSEKVRSTFKSTRLINAHTSEVMGKGDLDFRIDHRFDNVSVGHDALWGFDNIRDMRLAFEYGVSNKLTVAFGRSKGSFFDAFVKYKVLHQTEDGKMPLTFTWYSNVGAQVTGGGKEMNVNHRFSYVHQAIFARKFSPYFSIQLMPILVHRNLVADYEENDFLAIGAGLRYMFTRSSGIILDFYQPVMTFHKDSPTYFPPLGIGYELETGGHVFHITLTNASFITENKFIPVSTDGWEDENFKFGFNISRVF